MQTPTRFKDIICIYLRIEKKIRCKQVQCDYYDGKDGKIQAFKINNIIVPR